MLEYPVVQSAQLDTQVLSCHILGYASDISSDALQVVHLNCQRHHVAERVRLLQGNLVSSLPEPVDLLLANLPYVGTDELEDISPDI